ncbi:aBC-type multidrug transport system ATPase component [Eubacterium sp. CAG:786]|nr:aBC-type multidrug transport system ATPase component [Eubacterium sp. CAG:786]
MIEVKNAVMRFEDKNALDGISLTIPEGCAYGLLGSNGAGKSTLLRALSGINRLTGGEVLIDGQEVYDNAPVKERVFFINDETVQFNSMTLTEMKQYYKSFYSSFDEALWEKLHSALDLPLKKRLNTFSKGMKRQAAVICGIACRTPYLFLDEAFDGLDPTMRIIVKQMLIDAMMDTGLTVIFSSHNLGEIDEFCDRVGLLHNGKVVFDRELDSVKGSVFKIQTAFDQPVTKEQISAEGVDILHMEANGSVMHIIARGDREKIRAAVEKLSPKLYDEIPLSLEEIFVYEMEVLGYDSSKLGG